MPEHTTKQISGANHTSCVQTLHGSHAEFSSKVMQGWSHLEDTQLGVKAAVQSTDPVNLLQNEALSSR